MKNVDIHPFIVPLPVVPWKFRKFVEVLKNRYK